MKAAFLMKRLLLVLSLALLGPGCVYTSVQRGDTKLTRISLFGNQSVQEVDLEKGKLVGYKSEQAQVAEALMKQVYEAGLAAGKAAK